MAHTNREDQDGVSVVGFEIPGSPDSSYNNPIIPANDDEARDPPLVPPHLQNPLLNFPASRDDSSSLPLPQLHVILNHLYIENREGPRSIGRRSRNHPPLPFKVCCCCTLQTTPEKMTAWLHLYIMRWDEYDPHECTPFGTVCPP